MKIKEIMKGYSMDGKGPHGKGNGPGKGKGCKSKNKDNEDNPKDSLFNQEFKKALQKRIKNMDIKKVTKD